MKFLNTVSLSFPNLFWSVHKTYEIEGIPFVEHDHHPEDARTLAAFDKKKRTPGTFLKTYPSLVGTSGRKETQELQMPLIPDIWEYLNDPIDLDFDLLFNDEPRLVHLTYHNIRPLEMYVVDHRAKVYWWLNGITIPEWKGSDKLPSNVPSSYFKGAVRDCPTHDNSVVKFSINANSVTYNPSNLLYFQVLIENPYLDLSLYVYGLPVQDHDKISNLLAWLHFALDEYPSMESFQFFILDTFLQNVML